MAYISNRQSVTPLMGERELICAKGHTLLTLYRFYPKFISCNKGSGLYRSLEVVTIVSFRLLKFERDNASMVNDKPRMICARERSTVCIYAINWRCLCAGLLAVTPRYLNFAGEVFVCLMGLSFCSYGQTVQTRWNNFYCQVLGVLIFIKEAG